MRIKDIRSIKDELLKSLAQSRKVCILTHKNPDGDGLCAALALQEILLASKISADIILEEEVADNYDFLQGDQRCKVFRNDMLYDLLIILDCHEEERLGKCALLISTARNIFAFDHHPEQELIPGSRNYIEPDFVSVGALLFAMFEQEIDSLPSDSAHYIAKALYTTIINDTDNFINLNTDAATFRLCSKLMKYDIQPGSITEQFLMSRPVNEIRFIGEALFRIQTFDADQILFILTTREMQERHGLQNREVSKLTRWVKGVKNVKVIVSFQEINLQRYRLSLRSNHIDVNKIAVKYGGGGHQRASGCEIKASLQQVQELLLADIRQQL